ncbi:hypothetical protein ACSBR2_036774 [Camellia fascicularis]
MASGEREFEEQLQEAGNRLLQPPSSVDELLPLLDQVEIFLSRVEQSPLKSMQTALSPSMKALVAVTSPKHASRLDKDEVHFEETTKTNSKRKRTPGKEKASDAIEYDSNLIGKKVKVWWPDDDMFYEGVIDGFDPVKKKHNVSYTDGDEEILNLRNERWELVSGNSESDGAQKEESENKP